MKYTREQWAKLNEEERSWLVYFYKHENDGWGYGGYLPDDCGECPVCGRPVLGGGICIYCLNRALELEKTMGR